jgi:hypothetical protein
VRKADLRPIGAYAVRLVEAELRSESLPADSLGPLDPDAVRLAKTASRSVLGFMNEIAVHLRYGVTDAGGLNHCNISALNHHLRRTLHNRGGYVYPLELVGSATRCARLIDPRRRTHPRLPSRRVSLRTLRAEHGLEQLARPVKDAIYRRRFALKNRERRSTGCCC